MSFKASAPGSLMLLGEYAVLYGKYALVCAIDKRITVTLTPRQDAQITIHSALGTHHTFVSAIQIVAPFQFVLATLKKFQTQLPSGCDIVIEADFSATIGFGSSAAVTVAMLSALHAWLQKSCAKKKLIELGRQIIRSVQGLGSGADVAASVMGGIVAYRANPLTVKKFSETYPLTVIYSGSKTPTVQAILQVKANFSHEKKVFKRIVQSIDACARCGIQAVARQEWTRLGKIMTIQQGLMVALGVNTPALQHIMTALSSETSILGAKISGSGLGDCVVALGQSAHATNEIKITLTGIQ